MRERCVPKLPAKWAAAKAVSAVPHVRSAGNLGSLQVQLCFAPTSACPAH